MKINAIGINPPRLPQPTDVHVQQRGGCWTTRLETAQFANGTYLTQLEAIAAGTRQARDAASLLLIYSWSGVVRDTRDFAKWVDPFG